MALRRNFEYLKISIKNPEPLFDSSYMFLDWHSDLEEYVKATVKIKELLATIKTIKSKNKDPAEYYKDLFQLWNTKFSGQSELNCFLAACDVSRNDIKTEKLLKIVVDMYLKHRTFNMETPKEWIQALLDSIASKSKGKCGENKIRKIAECTGFKLVDNWENFLRYDKVVAHFSSNIFNIFNIKKNLGIELPNDKQNKLLDIILKNNNNFAFIEAKHLKEQGGEQNKQIEELISLLKHSVKKRKNQNVILIAFLDGTYSNKLISNIPCEELESSKLLREMPEKLKVDKQRKDIMVTLRNNEKSLWFNTAGYKKFVCDFFNLI